MLDTQASESHDPRVLNFINKLKFKKVEGSYNLAIESVELLKSIISQNDWKTAKEIIHLIKSEAKFLTKAVPFHTPVGNMVRQILKIVREEYVAGCKDRLEEIDPQDSLHKIVSSEGEVNDYSKLIDDLKEAILDHISEFQMELETSSDNISQQAREHIHSNEIIMTIGTSREVKAFLKKAAQDRKFEVIVAECAPFCHTFNNFDKENECSAIESKTKSINAP
uniref:Translation initiation factor eIF2B subunit beta n=1 Tax=Clastoptera arizonana TaxID=38151 RepID=A0A1B6CAH8_9HEMI